MVLSAASAKACIFGGILLAAIGGIVGIAFMVSDEFVIAKISCLASSNDAACPSDGFVQFNGEDCQVGNLGLYESAFTPNCADGTSYEINEALDEFEGDPLEFGPLFPAQTGLAGLLNDFTGQTGVPAVEPEFESCEQYFEAGGATQVFIESASHLPLVAGLVDIDEALRGFYADAISTIFTETNNFFTNAGFLLAREAYNALVDNGCVSAPSEIPSDLTDVVTGAAGCGGTAGPISLSLAFTSNAGAFAGVDIYDFALAALAASGGATNTAIAFSTGLAAGSVDNGGPIQPLEADDSMWKSFAPNPAVSVTCVGLGIADDVALNGGVCSYIDILVAVIGSLPPGDAADAAAPLLAFWTQTEIGLFQQLPFQVSDPSLINRTAFENVVANNDPEVAAIILQFQTLEDSTIGFVNVGDGVPPVTGVIDGKILDFTEPLSSNTDLGTVALGLLCNVVDAGDDCSWLQLIGAAANNSLVPQDLQGTLGLYAATMGSCLPGTTDLATCLFIRRTTPNPLLGNLKMSDFIAQQFLGGLYSDIETEGATLEQVFTAAIAECNLDEEDAEAIENAQILAPLGTASILVGTVLASVSAVSSKKVLGIVSGVLALAGGFLFLGALVGVQQAPVFDAVGEGGPIEDNETIYETGFAATLALVTIGCGIAGPFLLIIGFAAQPPTEDVKDLTNVGKF